MIKKILLLLVALSFTACSSIQEKMPKRQACTGDESGKTLAEVFCKK